MAQNSIKTYEMKEKIILGIETSCDDTSFALLKGDPDNLNQAPLLLSHQSFSQETMLAKWGGVVPEIAARNHLEKITPLMELCFKESGIKINDVDLIAVTTHPGLLGPLLTGINCAKTLSLLHGLPVASVNHLYAHLEAIHLTTPISYPYLGLLVSGGHSLYLKVTAPTEFEILGNTIDDAAGEAFDKGGKLLGVGYPAGKIIDDLAQTGDPKKYSFPISYMRDRPGKMSYSGLKTALRVKLEKMTPEEIKTDLHDICAGYQEAIVQTLRIKAEEIIEKILNLKLKTFDTPIVIGGGVACNSRLKAVMEQHFKNVHVVKPVFCTDNAGMVANWAARVPELAVSYPECLALDARNRFVEKK